MTIKMTMVDGAIIEGTAEEIAKMSRLLEGEDADADDNPVEETITHKGAEYTLVDRKAQEGDVVVFTENMSGSFINGKAYGPVDRRIRIEENDNIGDMLDVGNANYNRTESNTLVYEPIAEAEPEFSEGDKIRVVKPVIEYGRYGKGDVFTVKEFVAETDITHAYVSVEESDNFILIIDEVEKEIVAETDITHADVFTVKVELSDEDDPSIKEGDYAKVVGGTRYGDLNRGYYVKVTGVFEATYGENIRISLLDGSDFDHAYEDALERVELTDEDITLIKLGREPGEHKKGDIVEVKRRYGPLDKGDIGVVVHGDTDGTPLVKFGQMELYIRCKLIVPVESRDDKRD